MVELKEVKMLRSHLLVICVVLFSLISCNDNDNNQQKQSNQNRGSEKTLVDVGIDLYSYYDSVKIDNNDTIIAQEAVLKKALDNPDISDAELSNGELTYLYKGEVGTIILACKDYILEDIYQINKNLQPIYMNHETLEKNHTTEKGLLNDSELSTSIEKLKKQNLKYPFNNKVLLFGTESGDRKYNKFTEWDKCFGNDTSDFWYSGLIEHAEQIFNDSLVIDFQITKLYGTKADLRSIHSWGDYGTIIINSHGGHQTWNTSNGNESYIVIHDSIESAYIKKYSLNSIEDFKRVGLQQVITKDRNIYLRVYAAFLDRYCNLNNTFIFMGTSYSNHNNSMYNSLRNAGAKVFIGWNKLARKHSIQSTITDNILVSMIPNDINESVFSAKEADLNFSNNEKEIRYEKAWEYFVFIPKLSISSPLNNSTFEKGQQINFGAECVNDLCHKINIKWFDDNNIEIGNSWNFYYNQLPIGQHNIKVIATSPKAPNVKIYSDDINILINEKTSPSVCQWHLYSPDILQGNDQGKKYLLFFCSKDCGYCLKMKNETFSSPDVCSYLNEHFISIKVDKDENPEVFSSFEVRAIPICIFIDEKGRRISNLPGYVPHDYFLNYLKKLNSNSIKHQFSQGQSFDLPSTNEFTLIKPGKGYSIKYKNTFVKSNTIASPKMQNVDNSFIVKKKSLTTMGNVKQGLSGCVDYLDGPLSNSKVMLIQPGEIFQTSDLDSSGCYHFPKVNTKKSFSIMIRKSFEKK